LAAQTCYQAPQKCIGYCKQALDLARQFHDPGVKATALRLQRERRHGKNPGIQQRSTDNI
jgi:hypothetical protein